MNCCRADWLATATEAPVSQAVRENPKDGDFVSDICEEWIFDIEVGQEGHPALVPDGFGGLGAGSGDSLPGFESDSTEISFESSAGGGCCICQESF